MILLQIIQNKHEQIQQKNLAQNCFFVIFPLDLSQKEIQRYHVVGYYMVVAVFIGTVFVIIQELINLTSDCENDRTSSAKRSAIRTVLRLTQLLPHSPTG